MLSLIYKEMKEKDAKVDEYMKSNNSQMKNMEFQIGQLATTVGHMQNKGKFPSTTESNPKEHCKVIELRSGTRYQGPPLPNELDEEKEKEDEIEQEVEDEKVSEKDEDEEIAPFRDDEEEKCMMKNDKEEMKKKQKKDESEQKVPKWKLARDLKEKRSDEVECDEWGIPKIPDRVPFPQRFVKKKLDENFAKFLEVFKKLHINIPFYDALEQMPNYAKFLKDLLSKRRRIEEPEMVKLTMECSALLKKNLPKKLKDPGSFNIFCDMGNGVKKNALCDLGASINLMPLSIFEKLDYGDLRPTSMTLQLADRSTTVPRGIVEDILVKVENLVFPTDFVVLEWKRMHKCLSFLEDHSWPPRV
ncbi:hypothetical protein ACS0TY_027572 [Phlomoides rotata]